MTLALSDWLIVALYFVASAAIALVYTRRASESLEDYFVSGRCAPLVAGRHLDGGDHLRGGHAAGRRRAGRQVRGGGQLALVERRDLGNPDRVLLRPALAAGRRADRLEFAELRYGGQAGGGRSGDSAALYLALPINLIIMGWVTRAMVTILQISLDINPWTAALAPVRRHRALQRSSRGCGAWS